MKTLDKNKLAQNAQDKVLFKMTPDKSFKLANDFSMFLLNLNKPSKKKNGFSKSNSKNRKNS